MTRLLLSKIMALRSSNPSQAGKSVTNNGLHVHFCIPLPYDSAAGVKRTTCSDDTKTIINETVSLVEVNVRHVLFTSHSTHSLFKNSISENLRLCHHSSKFAMAEPAECWKAIDCPKTILHPYHLLLEQLRMNQTSDITCIHLTYYIGHQISAKMIHIITLWLQVRVHYSKLRESDSGLSPTLTSTSMAV